MISIQKNEPLSNHTSIKIGGHANFFAIVESSADLKEAIQWALDRKLPYFILGGGTNTVFADQDFNGLVIKQQSGQIPAEIAKGTFPLIDIKSDFDASQLNFDLGYDDWHANRLLNVDGGYPLAGLIKHCLTRGLVGLEWFAGIPGTVAGAIIGNIHGGPRFFGSRVQSVTVLDENLAEKTLNSDQLDFAYDRSVFKQQPAPIVSAEIALYSTNHEYINKAKSFARTWVIYKSSRRPKNLNCGSIFQNISDEEAKKLALPTVSAGWLIDSVGLKGYRLGDVAFAAEHANFIVNLGDGRYEDFKKLVLMAQEKVKAKFGVDLKLEIIMIEP